MLQPPRSLPVGQSCGLGYFQQRRLMGSGHPTLLLWTAMKEGLLGGTLDVSPRSESKEARLHVARWAGSESKEDRRLPAVAGARGRRRGPPRRTPTGCVGCHPYRDVERGG